MHEATNLYMYVLNINAGAHWAQSSLQRFIAKQNTSVLKESGCSIFATEVHAY